MALRTFVKISGINNLSDARYCAGMHVDLIGFNLNPDNSNYVSPDKFKELSEWVSGVGFVAEFDDLDVNTINQIISQYDIDYIQTSRIDHIGKLGIDKPVILQVNMEDLDRLPKRLEMAYLLIEGQAESLDDETKASVRALSEGYNILLGIDIPVDQIDTVMSKTGAYGLALRGGDEIRPGFKDYDELADILEALEEDEWA